MYNLDSCNKLIEEFEKVIEKPKKITKDTKLYCGVDLGTAFIVIAVIDQNGQPIAGKYQFANVIKDGMVVDYIGAVDIVRNLKESLEKDLNVELTLASCAIPPGTESIDGGVVKNVVEAAGFIVSSVTDEATAANQIINMDKGAVVDIGGGTTGIAIIQDKKVVKVVDEATGGTHFTLVISGAKKISFDEAELFKRHEKNHQEARLLVNPVIDKISSIIEKSIKGYDVDDLVLVGGTACLSGIEEQVEKNININTDKPKNPLFVTPLGIAKTCRDSEES